MLVSRARIAVLGALITSVLAVGLAAAQPAAAFKEQYGFVSVGNEGFVQSGGAHTFAFNTGAGENGGRLACQLFNSKGVNEVGHGNNVCSVFYGGGEFVTARVYNQSGGTQVIGGEAET
jgi:hypothetical protein